MALKDPFSIVVTDFLQTINNPEIKPFATMAFRAFISATEKIVFRFRLGIANDFCGYPDVSPLRISVINLIPDSRMAAKDNADPFFHQISW